MLEDPQDPLGKNRLRAFETAARSLGVHPVPIEVRSVAAFETAFKAVARQQANGLLVNRTPLIVPNMTLIVSLTAKARLPAIYDDAGFTEAGGLMSYGANIPALYRHLATYVDKIIKGAKPGDLPIEQPTKFELVLNMKTAKALGIKFPQSILVRADRIIE